MEQMVAAVSKLEQVAALLGPDVVHLPQIVVVGDQSSGKSSVLEGLIGRSFLPKGVGGVTKVPLIVQFCQDTGIGDCGVFSHNSEKLYKNIIEIKQEIIRINDSYGKINKKPIILKMNSQTISGLTLVDLPGIIPNENNEIEDLILDYIGNPNSLILAVVSANTDMMNSESIKLAKQVDPTGERTMVVVTKLDLIEGDSKFEGILKEQVALIRLDVIGVINKFQVDRQALKDEIIFFKNQYPDIAHKSGTLYLSKVVQNFLLNHLEKRIPDILNAINSTIIKCNKILKCFGDDLDANGTLLQLISTFNTSYCSKISGIYEEMETSQLTGGARISYIFHETFRHALENIDPLKGFTRSGIATAIRNTCGVKPSLFVPETCFEILAKKQINLLRQPSLTCVQLINNELERVLSECGKEITLGLDRFPLLCQTLLNHAKTLINSRLNETKDMVGKLIDIHLAYINTAHPDFAIIKSQKPKQLQIKGPIGSQETDCNQDSGLVEKLIVSYFNLVRKTVQDSVPKTIMHFMVNHVNEKLLSELVGKVFSEGTPTFKEELEDARRAKTKITALLEAHEKARVLINELKNSLNKKK